jgi:predicted DNA-binding transcriptional regulator YafY
VSFAKAEQLLRLAMLAAGRQMGISLAEIAEEFGCNHRTAQRMTRALEMLFADVDTLTDGERRKRWRLRDQGLGPLLRLSPRELSTLAVAADELDRLGDPETAAEISALRDKLFAILPATAARRAEVDADALLEAQGFAARPGPRSASRPGVDRVVSEALTGPFMLSLRYQGKADEEPRDRVVAPYGLILGQRRYLVAKALEAMEGPLRHFRMDRVLSAEVLPMGFVREQGFDIQAYARRAFGAFQNDEQFGEVVWRFDQRAADTARGFNFHPGQVFEAQPDGALIVRFTASGWYEMCWHLYQWGDAVGVIAPADLRRMVEGHRRADFYPVLP